MTSWTYDILNEWMFYMGGKVVASAFRWASHLRKDRPVGVTILDENTGQMEYCALNFADYDSAKRMVEAELINRGILTVA
jgi:hypothetical protein